MARLETVLLLSLVLSVAIDILSKLLERGRQSINPRNMKKTSALIGLASLIAATAMAAPEAFEIGPDNTDQLPRGKEADGIIGDFVLRNDKVEAVISHNAHLRRANMSTFYGDNGVTPGCLYDLTLRGSNNDQITVFTPSGQQGKVAYVKIAKSGESGSASIETVVSSAMNKGLYKRHEYIVRDGWQGVLIVTTMRNEGTTPFKGRVNDRWTNFSSRGQFAGINWGDSIDPADKAGYAYDWVEQDGMKRPGGEVSLNPGDEISFARFLAVGTSPAEAVGVVATFKGSPVGRVEGELVDAGGKGLGTPVVNFKLGSSRLPAYPDSKGRFAFKIPVGDYDVEARDHGRRTLTLPQSVGTSGRKEMRFGFGPASAVAFDIQDEKGTSIPCKAQFIGINGTKSPNLGPDNRAHGCKDQYHSENGEFRVQLDPGDYRIVVTHGVEFSHLSREIKLAAGKTVAVKGVLKRLVRSKGWVSADFHNHSTPSGDNTCGTDDRVINLAAEHIEFAPTTEHNRLYDWTPHIEKLGLTYEIKTVPGTEFTGRMAHMNMFPLKPVAFVQDGGLPAYQMDPRLNALVLRRLQGEEKDRWIQINHPDMVQNFNDRNADGKHDEGFVGLENMIDGIETQNYSASEILNPFPYIIYRRGTREYARVTREFQWLQNLNRGHRYWGVAVADAHRVHGNGVGGWRTYVKSSIDEPSKLDWRELTRNSRNGQMVLSTGPFLEVETEDGVIAGGETKAKGSIELKVRVQCTDWIDIDRVQVLVNGRQIPELNFTRAKNAGMFKDGVVKFDRTVKVPLKEDAHLIVVAYGENFNLKTGYGTSAQAGIKPCAYNNPIFVDVDGGGFQPNGDLLDYPLPVGGVSVEDVKAMMEARKK